MSRQRKKLTVRKHELEKTRKDTEHCSFKPDTTKSKRTFSHSPALEKTNFADCAATHTPYVYDLDETVYQSPAGNPSTEILRSANGTDPLDIWIKFDGDPKQAGQRTWPVTLRKQALPDVPRPATVSELSEKELPSTLASAEKFDAAETHKFSHPYRLTHSPRAGVQEMYDDLRMKQGALTNPVLQRTLYGDYASGLKHKDRPTSEWVHQLRGGFLPSLIDASTESFTSGARRPTTSPGPCQRALNKHSHSPNN